MNTNQQIERFQKVLLRGVYFQVSRISCVSLSALLGQFHFDNKKEDIIQAFALCEDEVRQGESTIEHQSKIHDVVV